jgi:signal transduction histidine kinase
MAINHSFLSYIALASPTSTSIFERFRCAGTKKGRLEQSLSDFGDEFDVRARKGFRILVSGHSRALNPAVQEQLCLIVREALRNAVLHAEAACVEAEVEYLQGKVRVVVRDNGCGINPQTLTACGKSRGGLLDMRERAANIGAQMRVWSRRGAGTEVEISVPGEIAQAAAKAV